MGTGKVKQILVAPLDWGLGHTTRCMPLIRHITGMGHRVIIAGNHIQRDFLSRTFPGLTQWHLDGYGVRYTRSSCLFAPAILAQVPRIANRIRKEHHWLKKQAQDHDIDGIISDNRYGLHHPHISSVILTHQLQIATGMGSLPDDLVRRLHYRYLRPFDRVWVPDVAGFPNLSGILGHPRTRPAHANYIGLLPQFPAAAGPDTGTGVLILLSGPEPQRSMLSDLLWEQACSAPDKLTFVEGSDVMRSDIPAHISYHGRLSAASLQPVLSAARIVVCRSGYSTLMDLTALGKKAILIPTPGQTEQEYLAGYLHRQGIFYACSQKNFRLQEALAASTAFPFQHADIRNAFGHYQATLESWINGL